MFNYVRVPRNLYRTSMNYLNAIASDNLIVRKILDTATFGTFLSAFNEKNITGSALVDNLQNKHVIGLEDPITFNIALSGLNFPFPSLTDDLYKKLDESADTDWFVVGTNTEVESVSSLFPYIVSVPTEVANNAFLIVKATNTEVESLSSLYEDVVSIPKERANNTFLIVKATNTEVESLSSLLNDITSIPKERANNTFLIVKATNTEVESLSSLLNDITSIPKNATSVSECISGYNSDYYNLSSVFNNIPGEIASVPPTERAVTFACISGYKSDYFNLSSVFNLIPGERISSLSEHGSQSMSVTASNFDFDFFEAFEPNSDVTVDDALLVENLSAINSAASDFLIVANRYTDADAAAYLNLVELADGQPLEVGVKNSVHEFVLRCKQSGVWSSIVNCFIFCGARTLNGALVPLKGNAVSFHNFSSASYNRKLLQGNGTSYINLGVNSSTADSFHSAAYKSVSTGALQYYFGDIVSSTITSISMRSDGASRHKTTTLHVPSNSGEKTGVHIIRRFTSGGYNIRYGGSTFNSSSNADLYISRPLTLFKVGTNAPSTVGLSFFSLGTVLNLDPYEELISRLVYQLQSYLT